MPLVHFLTHGASMSDTRPDLTVDLGPALAELVGSAVEERLAGTTDALQPYPWLNAKQAAEYLCCPLSRIRKLTSAGDLPVHHDGSRVLYRRDELDAYIYAGGAISP